MNRIFNKAGVEQIYTDITKILEESQTYIEEIERTVNKLENCRIRGTDLIPAADRQYAAQTRELAEQLRNLKEAMGQLNEFLADVPLHTDYTSFAARLAVT